ncbi:MAG: diguanylate cyclase [Burkholderiaceae bacterium]
MEATRPAALTGAAQDAAQLAKAALRRLALDKLEPTPENYARAWRQEAGEASEPPADGPAIAALIGRIVRGIERGSKGWTAARKKDSLQRVLEGSRSDLRRLQQRLGQLVASWDSDAAPPAETSDDEPQTVFAAMPTSDAPLETVAALPWGRAVQVLGVTVQAALPVNGEEPHEITLALAALIERIEQDGATPALIDDLEALCRRAAPVLQHRHHLLDQLGALCAELTASLTDLAENDSWAKGQCEAMRVKIDEGLSARGIRAVSELLRDTRERQGQLRAERERARDSLKGLINRMLSELDELGSRTGHFHDSVGRYADVIEKADSLESLAGAVREMVEESRSVQALVQQTQSRLQEEHGKAQGLTQRVSELESEMQRLSSEVATDQLTQVANRRGLAQAFEAERARVERSGTTLSVGLLDIDNFKRLNDELGHGAGDEALKSLAAIVSTTLRPTDRVARYGGEEFVVLLPDTPVAEAQQILTRLQRSLTGGLFMHENKQVFVTFSAGVTDYRPGERIEAALERADRGLYEAKRTGKNRTCLG